MSPRIVLLCALLAAVVVADLDLAALRPMLQASIDERAFPGVAFAVVTRDATRTDAIGRHMYDASLLPANPPVDARDTLFDLASLTKGPFLLCVCAPVSLPSLLRSLHVNVCFCKYVTALYS